MFPSGAPSSGGGFDPTKKTFNFIDSRSQSVNVPAAGVLDILTISGAGVLSELVASIWGTNCVYLGLSLVVDGTERKFHAPSGTTESLVSAISGAIQLAGAPTGIQTRINMPISWKTSLAVRLRNNNAANATGTSISAMLHGGYMT